MKRQGSLAMSALMVLSSFGMGWAEDPKQPQGPAEAPKPAAEPAASAAAKPAHAETTDLEEVEKELQNTAAAAKPAAAAPKNSGTLESMSTEPTDFNFKDTDLLSILRSFALKYNRNIIASAGVGGKVSLQLHNVPFDEAFRILLDHMELVAVQKGSNVIQIIKSSDVPFLVEVFSLRYRFANELQTTLTNMLRGKERDSTTISVDIASNSLIVTSTNDILRKLHSLVDQMDLQAPQITIKARMIEVQAGSALQWGVTWANSAPFGGKSQSGRVQEFLDTRKYSTFNAAGEPTTSQVPLQFPDGGVLTVSSVIGKTQLYGLLNALKTDHAAKTISEPMVLTGNNKAAKIHVGQNLPVKTSQVTQTATTQSIQYIPEGVDLEVTPIVSPASSVISFKIRVNVSELVGFQNDAPITTERSATTEVSIESGKTVVIGGLIKDTLRDDVSGIPFLKDIPILGYLFKSKRKTKDKTELLIFITPELLQR
ncbi:MAG: hypothetical protein HY078_04145 [Elusimicrobia bacterium]|nr:hypothetical protein [Elusimicrobiota bacterium]